MVTQPRKPLPLGAESSPGGGPWNGWFRQNQGNFWNNNLYKYVRYFGLESEMQHNME